MIFDALKAEAAQKRFCVEKGVPFFAPRGGRCFRCGKNVFGVYDRAGNALVCGGEVGDIGENMRRGVCEGDEMLRSAGENGVWVEARGGELWRRGVLAGYDVSRAGNEHITGCPFCHATFCD